MADLLKQLERVRAENMRATYVHPSYLLECELASAMEACRREKSLEILHTINSLERAHLAESPLRSLQYSLICGCTCYTRTAIRAGVDSETAFDLSDLFIREIGKTNSVPALTELEKTMLLSFIGLIERSAVADHTGNPTVDRIIQYIRNNINRRVTLGDISKEIGLHPAYISALFSEKTGMTVSEFTDQCRIHAIEELLSDSDMKMLDIAELFSFSSAAHFSTYFKKNTGVTPRAYRSTHMKKV